MTTMPEGEEIKPVELGERVILPQDMMIPIPVAYMVDAYGKLNPAFDGLVLVLGPTGQVTWKKLPQ